MNRLSLAVLVSCAVAVPSDASPPEAGLPCAVNVTAFPDSHLGARNGEMHGGPWVVAGAPDVTLTCEIEVGTAACYDTTVGYRGTSEPLPSVAVLDPRLVSYWNPYAQPVYLGTTVSWTDASGARVTRNVDFDASTPGEQCAVVDWGNEG